MADHYHHEKKKMTYIVFALLIVAFGIVLWRVLKMKGEPQSGEISVEISTEGIVSKDLEYDTKGMMPGDSREYKLIITAKDAANYSLVFGLETENASGSAFARFVSVSILDGEEPVGNATLQEGFDGKTFTLEKWIGSSSSIEVTIKYEMSIDATDEVQGAVADFDLTLSASGTVQGEE